MVLGARRYGHSFFLQAQSHPFRIVKDITQEVLPTMGRSHKGTDDWGPWTGHRSGWSLILPGLEDAPGGSVSPVPSPLSHVLCSPTFRATSAAVTGTAEPRASLLLRL